MARRQLTLCKNCKCGFWAVSVQQHFVTLTCEICDRRVLIAIELDHGRPRELDLVPVVTNNGNPARAAPAWAPDSKEV